MAVLQKVKINGEWVSISNSNVNSGGGITEEKEVYIGADEPSGAKLWVNTDEEKIKYKDENKEWKEIAIGGGGGGNANVLVINSHVDFIIGEGLNTIGGVINDENITYAKVQEAVDNGYTIALKEPSGNISYCIKADYAVPNQNGEKRIMLFFSWRISDVEYAAVLYVGLDSSLTYMKWKLDLATKEYVDGAIEDIPSGGGGSIDPDVLDAYTPLIRDFNDDFNNDFTR